jgi:hypothetical protein
MKTKNKQSKFIDFLIAFGSLFSVMIFIIILYGSLKYFIGLDLGNANFNAQMFYFGLMCAVVYSIGNWIVSFVNDFEKSYNNLISKRGKGVA